MIRLSFTLAVLLIVIDRQLQMDKPNQPILDMDYFRHTAPAVVRNQYFEAVASEADVMLRSLQESSSFNLNAVEWCLESDQFFEETSRVPLGAESAENVVSLS